MIGHLLHVGYPKTGSKFLQQWFGGHPQLAYADGGIAGFRDVYAIARESIMPRSGVRYRVTSYEGFLAPQANAGEIVVEYSRERRMDMPSAQSCACTTLAELFPGALVLIVTRGFRSMILSSYSQYVRAGGDVDLAELLAAARSRQTTHLDHLLERDPWDYDRTIDLYRRAFGDDNVIVMPYELLRDDADAFTHWLEARLGLTHFAGPEDRVNTSLSPAEMYWYPRLARAAQRLPIGSRLRRAYQHGVFANRFRAVVAMLQRLAPGTPVTPDVIAEEHVNAFRGKASSLRDHPLYQPYARDYLFHL